MTEQSPELTALMTLSAEKSIFPPTCWIADCTAHTALWSCPKSQLRFCASCPRAAGVPLTASISRLLFWLSAIWLRSESICARTAGSLPLLLFAIAAPLILRPGERSARSPNPDSIARTFLPVIPVIRAISEGYSPPRRRASTSRWRASTTSSRRDLDRTRRSSSSVTSQTALTVSENISDFLIITC